MLSRLRLPLIAAAAAFLLHLVCNPHYGFFRDELYFIVCGQHPQWNYVDQPPVAPLLAAASQLFGPSLLLLRAFPAVFAAAGAYVTCLLVSELGGAAFAQGIAALTVFFVPVLADFGMKVSPDMTHLWLWPLLALYTIRLTKGANPRLWIAFGAASSLAILSKYVVLFFLFALLLALLLTPQRRILFSPWFPGGVAVAMLMVLPAFLWQAHYGFPMLELLRNGQHGKNVIFGPVQYLLQQLLLSGFLWPVWIVGLVWLLRRPQFRYLGYAYLILIAIMLALHGKNYYPFNVYPCLVAAGAVVIERWSASSRVARVAIATSVLLLGALTFPLVVPVLPEATAAQYVARFFSLLGIRRGSMNNEHEKTAELTSDFAGMHGWPELAASVKAVYKSLPPQERAQAVIFARNYSDAAAIEFFGHLPVISSHNQYFLWGPRGYSGNVTICPGSDCGGSRNFQSCTVAATFEVPWTDANLRGVPITVCRGLKQPMAELWPKTKVYE